jgi:hypothetical protein
LAPASHAHAIPSVATPPERFAVPISHARRDVLRTLNAHLRAGIANGQRAVDAVAYRLSSWGLPLAQSAILAAWIAFNVAEIVLRPFNPRPIIVLDLFLSFHFAYGALALLLGAGRQKANHWPPRPFGYDPGHPALDEQRAIMRHLEAQDDLLRMLLGAVTAVEREVVWHAERIDAGIDANRHSAPPDT